MSEVMWGLCQFTCRNSCLHLGVATQLVETLCTHNCAAGSAHQRIVTNACPGLLIMPLNHRNVQGVHLLAVVMQFMRTCSL